MPSDLRTEVARRRTFAIISHPDAGKTTLTKGIAAGLGAARKDDVTSPTFTLLHEYGAERKVFHGDLYRLENFHDSLAFEPRPALLMLSGAVGVLFLIVCANIANLQLGRAVTRARDELYLTYPHMRLNAGYGDVFQRPSRFLKEIPNALVEDWNVRRG